MQPPALPSRPDTREYRDNPVFTWFEWSVTQVLNALDAHEQGQFYEAAQLGDYLLRDDRVSATLGTRVNGLLGLPFEIRSAPYANQKRQGPICRALDRDWTKIIERDQLSEFIRWGRLMGFAVGELLWDTSGDRWVPSVKPWHPAYTWYNQVTRKYVVSTQDAGSVEITPGDGKWIVYKPHGAYRGWMHGSVRSIAIPTLLRQYCLRDMGRLGELFGLGIKKGKVPAQASQADKKNFLAQIQKAKSDGSIILPSYIDKATGKEIAFDFTIEGMDAGEGGAKLLELLSNRCDDCITLAHLGQNLTSSVKEGSLAAARVHGDVRQDYLEADVETLAEDIRSQILRPWALYNFGDPELAPIATWDATPPEDKSQMADTLSKLSDAVDKLSKVAPEVDRRALLERYGLPLLEDDDQGGDTAGQIFAYHLQAGVVTTNEVRAQLGLPPIEGGDNLIAPSEPTAPET